MGCTKKIVKIVTVALVAGALATAAPALAEARTKKPALNKTKVTLTVGQKTTLKIKNTKKKVKWVSSKKKIVVVSKKGKVTAKKAGKTTITASIGKKKYKCKVTVKAKAKAKIKSGSKTKDKVNTDSKPNTSTTKTTVVTREETLYAMGSSYSEALTIPSSLRTSIKLPSSADATYNLSTYDYIKVSKNGEVTPNYTYWKKMSNFYQSCNETDDYAYYTMKEGDTTVNVSANGKKYRYTIHLKDYVAYYTNKIMDDYIAANINTSMTDEEKLDAIVKFPASYDYSPKYSGAANMIVFGGGDCWASTSAIIQLCKKVGIDAWSRNGNKDSGAGSGHMNAIAKLNDSYYELEAGYSSNKNESTGLRPYHIKKRSSLFCYKTTYNNGTSFASVYQYDGKDIPENFVVPGTIDNLVVAEIGKNAFSGEKFSSVTLPETVTSISSGAFMNCSAMKSINIPSGVTAIGDRAFAGCKSLTTLALPAALNELGEAAFAACDSLSTLTLSNQNTSFILQDKIIYNSDMTEVVSGQLGSNVVLPSTVKKITAYAFAYSSTLISVTLPESVEEMGVSAFASCDNLKDVYFKGDAPTFGDGTYDYVFANNTLTAHTVNGNGTWDSTNMTDHNGNKITWVVD